MPNDPISGEVAKLEAQALPFVTYLKTQVGNHLTLVGGLALVGGLVVGVNYVRDLRTELDQQKKTAETLSQKFQTFGTSGVTANSAVTASTAATQAAATFDPRVLAYMKAQGASLQSLTTLVGQTQEEMQLIRTQNTTFTPSQQNTTTGALMNYPLEQARSEGPALTALHLSYDPKQTDPNVAFKGTSWVNYQENFQSSVGEWEKQSDGGLKTTVVLTRTVSKPDPLDPTKLVLVGTEKIPLLGANTVYTPKGLVDPNKLAVPRWTASFGASQETGATGWIPAALIDYRITTRFGAFAGLVNKAGVVGLSYRFGRK